MYTLCIHLTFICEVTNRKLLLFYSTQPVIQLIGSIVNTVMYIYLR